MLIDEIEVDLIIGGHITIHLALLEYEAPVHLTTGKTHTARLKMYMSAAIRAQVLLPRTRATQHV